jgi:hypothetical protein
VGNDVAGNSDKGELRREVGDGGTAEVGEVGSHVSAPLARARS